MKKITIIFALLLFAVVGFSQSIIVKTVANGSVGVDSVGVGDAQYTYYYVQGSSGTQNSRVHPLGTKATQPIKDYEVAYVMLGGEHSLVTVSQDSLLMSVQGSVDNSTWFHINLGSSVTTAGTGSPTVTYLAASSHFGTSNLTGYALYVITAGAMVYPYYRLVCEHMKATGNIYPKAYFVFKHL
jgi:hypothetical protein